MPVDAPTVEVADLEVTFVWSDSLGAKSTCCLVETPDLTLCLDPGVAAMQPTYPLPDDEKRRLAARARAEVRAAVARADAVSISHYHYDHFSTDPTLYRGTDLLLKDPNRWINRSQRDRARDFLAALAADRGVGLVERAPQQRTFRDPLDALVHTRRKDFGEYASRREELLANWRRRFERRTAEWVSEPWVVEPEFCTYVDNIGFERGETRVRFQGPLFHGIEYASTGWVLATVVETPEASFVHSSDLEGPIIEDYADWLIAECPDIVFLDGPSTYLLGFMVNRINLRRAIDNAHRILVDANPALLVWDHHLLRDPRFRERTRSVWNRRADGYRVTTLAELLGDEPRVERSGTGRR